VELESAITRTRKFALVRLLAVQLRPQVSVALPSVWVASEVLSVEVVLADVQEAPPFQEAR
jgi:hypothetical protein